MGSIGKSRFLAAALLLCTTLGADIVRNYSPPLACDGSGAVELDRAYQLDPVRGATFIIIEPLLVATAIYFCLCFPTSKIIGYFERRMRRGDSR